MGGFSWAFSCGVFCRFFPVICCCMWVIFVLLLARSCSAAGCAMMAFLTRTAKAAPQRWAILAQLGASVVRARACSCSAIRFTLHVLLLFGGGHLEGIVAQAQIGGCIRFLRQCSCPKPCQVHRSSQIPKSRTGRSCVAKFVELGLLGMVLRLQAPARTADPVEDAKKAFVPGCCCRAASLSFLACCRARA